MGLILKWKTVWAVAVTAIMLVVLLSTNPMMHTQLRMSPPGATLPSEMECAARIPVSSWEPRPNNRTANHTTPTPQQIASLQLWDRAIGMDQQSDVLRRWVTGNYIGTTDQILQWAACKWGIDPDIVRAQAVQESDWHQSMRSDYTSDAIQCPPGTWDGSGCYQSYGILQMKYSTMPSAWPISRDSTAFNADWVYGWIRNCYEDKADYLYRRTPLPGYPGYRAGDIWGCLGFWYSGGWYDQGAVDYIDNVKIIYSSRSWLQLGF